jgi:AcrR family transcriptional regulator
MDDRRRQILDAALALADERGLDGVSMRALATRLGVTPMALYPYVGSKAALLDGIVDRLLAELPVPEPELDWQEGLRRMAHGVRALARRHPAAFPLLFSRPAVTPDAVRAVERVYQALRAAGVPDPEVPRVERMVSTFVFGYAVSEVNGRFSTGTVNPRSRRGQLPPAELPAHQALARWLDADVDWDAEFDADLDDLERLLRPPT